MKTGDVVVHRDFGRGTIIRMYPEGPTAMVDFGYMTDLVPVDALNKSCTANGPAAAPSTSKVLASSTSTPRPEPVGTSVTRRPVSGNQPHISNSQISESKQPPNPISSPRPVRPVSDTSQRHKLAPETVEARRAIVALRLGQVLESHVDHLSVGLTDISLRFDATLQRARSHIPVYMLVEGAWGRGKTHLLTLLTAAAVRHEFAVSSVVMDGVGVTLSDPMQLLEAVTGAIRFPGDALPGGLSINLARARRQGGLERLGHLGATTLAAVFDQIPVAAFDEFDALQVIEDYLGLYLPASTAQHRLETLGFRGVRLPTLRARCVADRAARFSDLLFNWTQLCAVAGARGLVVILDELDVEYASTARSSQQATRLRKRRSELLEVLQRLRNQRLPLVLAFASAPAGAGIDPEHDASTNIAEALGVLDAHIAAPVPGDGELHELITKVLEIYRVAYPASFHGQAQEKIAGLADRLINNHRRQANPVPRHFVRSALESLDILTA